MSVLSGMRTFGRALLLFLIYVLFPVAAWAAIAYALYPLVIR